MKAAYRSSLILILQIVLTISSGATPPTPAQIAKNFINFVADKNMEEAAGLLSSRTINEAGGISAARTMLSTGLGFDFKKEIEKLEVLSMTVGREDIAGDSANVSIKTNLRFTMKPGRNNGTIPKPGDVFDFIFKLVKENQAWKVERIVVDYPKTNAGQRRAPTPTASQRPRTLDEEAVLAAKGLWDEHTTQCGSYYYSKTDFRGIITFNEYRNVTFIPKRRGPTSEADRLNGILWNGEVEILTRLYRANHEGTWSNWKERTPGGGYPITATKRQSGWVVLQLMEITNQQRVKCSEVPG
jgi:hypothetical protein